MGAYGPAMIAAAAAVLGIYLTQFLAERYRRFHDGSSLAAGLLGELNAYKPGYELMQKGLDRWISLALNGHSADIKMRGIENPGDLFFEEAVPKLGLLGPDIVADVIYVYQNIRAGRTALVVLDGQFADMSPEEFTARCKIVKAVMTDAWIRGQGLLPKLEARAHASFKMFSVR